MNFFHTAPLLLIIITGILMGLLGWGILLNRRQPGRHDFFEGSDHLRLWLLLLGAFSLGIFLAYTLEMWILVR
jgi:hypothetical protein